MMKAALKGSGTRLLEYEYGALADAALAARRPHYAVNDVKPVIAYFAADEDRDEFIETVQLANPNMRAVKV